MIYSVEGLLWIQHNHTSEQALRGLSTYMIRQVNKTGVSGVVPPEATLILIQQTLLH
ncbi:hypothetical protein DPMN_006463 [Dreissena polymorpha]|uniref:Uncharacterized protein n=1 Tax=Dreissena polymorpha TaxID=45954 RepID=A0A9D4MWK1_DREPO|nr:hypothetical protein DPMN_006463 [Dreissena polymorpha]